MELLPEVIDAAGTSPPRSTSAVPIRACTSSPPTRGATCAAATARYDVIVADNFHPARSGAGSLYTVEHFSRRARTPRARRRVLPVAAAAPARPRHPAQHRAFLPRRVSGWLGACWRATAWRRRCWVWSRDANPVRDSTWRSCAAIWRTPGWPACRRALGIEDEFALLGGFVAGPAALRRVSPADAPPNTDDHPGGGLSRTAHHLCAGLPAARAAGRAAAASCPSRPAELHRRCTPRPRLPHAAGGLLGRRATSSSPRAATSARAPMCTPCWRNCASRCSRCCAISPDFRPAYDPLLRMARALGTTDAAAAQSLLRRPRATAARPARSARCAGACRINAVRYHQTVTTPLTHRFDTAPASTQGGAGLQQAITRGAHSTMKVQT